MSGRIEKAILVVSSVAAQPASPEQGQANTRGAKASGPAAGLTAVSRHDTRQRVHDDDNLKEAGWVSRIRLHLRHAASKLKPDPPPVRRPSSPAQQSQPRNTPSASQSVMKAGGQ